MKSKQKIYWILLIIAFVNFSGHACYSQTFDCYITNDHLTSPTEYEFDVYVKATSTDFRIRTIQLAFTFNLGFVPAGATVTTIYIPGTTQMINYTPGAIQQSTPSASIAYAFQVGPNTGFTCANGTNVLTGQRVRIGSWRITSSLPFNCLPANPSIIRPSDPQFGSPVLLKFLISRWNTLDCSSGTLNTIFSSNGTFTSFTGNTLLDSLNNMRPYVISQPVADTVCANAGIATFSISAQGNGTDTNTNPLSYQWYEGNNALTNSGLYNGVSTSTLVINNPPFSMNGGIYSCKVLQGNPSSVEKKSSDAILKVIATDDDNACTVDNCDVETGLVTHELLPQINDNNLCTDDFCDPVTGNIIHTDNTINDNDVCTVDKCDPATGITSNTIALAVNTDSTPAGCSGNDGTGTANPSGGTLPYTYLWSPGGQTNQTATGLTSGNYNVLVTDGNGCSNSSTVDVTTSVTSQSPGPIQGPESVCSNQNNVVYCIDSVPGQSTYVWTLPPGAFIIGASYGKCITVKFNSNFCGGKICVNIASNCGNNNSCIYISRINSTPPPPLQISGAENLCPTSSGNFSVNPVPNSTGYLWTATGGLVINSGQGTTSVQVSSLPGFIRGTLSVQSTNCFGVSSKRKIILKGLPTTPLWDYDDKEDNPATVCGGSTYKYELHYNPDESCFIWSAPLGAVIFDRNGNFGNPLTITNSHIDDVTILFPQGFISGTVSVSYCNSCGSGIAATLNVRSVPSMPGLITGTQTVCKNSTLSYSVSKVSGAKYYYWSVTGGAIIHSGQGTNKIKVKFNSTTTSVVDLSVKAKNKCGFSDVSTSVIDVNLNCKSYGDNNEISINTNQDSTILSLAVFPNPADQQINLHFNSSGKGNCIFKLTDLEGKEISVKQINILEGINTLSMDASNLASGIYFAWIIRNENKWMEKIVLSR